MKDNNDELEKVTGGDDHIFISPGIPMPNGPGRGPSQPTKHLKSPKCFSPRIGQNRLKTQDDPFITIEFCMDCGYEFED